MILTRSTFNIIDQTEISFYLYFKDLAKYQIKSVDEENAIILKIQSGDEDAFNDLIISNLRFVVSVAKQYQNQGLSLTDLISEGNIGLISAAHRFDGTRGFRFISYAVWWIRQVITSAINNLGRNIILPSNQIEQVKKISRTLEILTQRLGREASIFEVAESIGIKVEELEQIKSYSFDTISLFEESKKTLGSLIDNLTDENFDDQDLINHLNSRLDQINMAILKLDKISAIVIQDYFGIN